MQRPNRPRPPLARVTAGALLLLLAPLHAHAQRTPLPLMDAAEEAALARSAATPDISEHAEVWVLAEDGFRLYAQGTNGWTCLVERDHPESLAPICYDPEGTRTLVPGVRRIEELRAGGLSYLAAVDSVEALYASGALDEPERPVYTTMLSRGQKLHASPEGPAVGAWRPHVMIFHPAFSNDDMALPPGGSVTVSRVGRIFNYLVIPVAAWSDGGVP